MSTAVENPALPSAVLRRQTKRTFGNLANVVGGEAMLRVASFVAAVVIARLGGAIAFGIYATTLAYATIAAMIADNGLQIGAVREISTKPGHTSQILSRLYMAKTLLFVPMVLVLFLLGWLAHLSKLEWTIASVLTLRTMVQSYCQMQISVLKAIDRVQAIGVIQGLHAALLLAALWRCYSSTTKVVVIVPVLLLGQCLEFALEAAWLRQSGIRLRAVRLRDCWRMMHGSTTVGITLALSNMIMRLDVIVLSFIATASVAGVFAAAQTVIVIAYVLGSLLSSVLFPEMNRLAGRAFEFQAYMRHWTKVTLVVVVPGTLAAMLAGPPLVRMLFGAKFAASAKLLGIMLPSAPFIVLNSLAMHKAFAFHERRIYLGIYCGAVLLAAILNPVMAVWFGAVGVAVAVVVREMAIFAAFRMVRADDMAAEVRTSFVTGVSSTP